jgi:UDP-N-acetylmuramoyl-L-alanyl-D-glutamate--2,6-diaminopimelate ligase
MPLPTPGTVPRVTDGPSTRLGDLAARIGGRLEGDPETLVTSVSHDSRTVAPGALFCCVPGDLADGHDFAAAATDAGAVALLCQRTLPLPVAQLVVDDVRAAMGPAAAAVAGDPSSLLDVVGVTGTNGKTTTVTLVAHVLGALGRPTEVVGTLTGARTTPEAPELQALLRDAVDRGRRAVAMEVSSHALAQHRVDGVQFDVVAFTNLGADHLDFHGTPERYFEAKAMLFAPGRARVAVLVIDDVHGRLLRDTIDLPVVEVSLDQAIDLVVDGAGSRYRWRGHDVRLPLIGRHNVTNALVASECCVALGVAPADVASALGSAPVPPGRFELVASGDGPTVVVDYAHTPDALERALEAARDISTGSVHVVFGCGGNRDVTKRPRMGAVADRLADVATVTSDNPRSEDPSTIMAAVRSGFERLVPRVVEDRRVAIEAAVAEARPGDVVLVAGKGHETTQVFADREIHFDDREVAAAALAARAGGSGPTP